MRIDDDVKLWLAVLTPPAAWAAHLQISYALAPSACDAQSRLMLLIVSVVCLVLPAMTSRTAYRLWRSYPTGTSQEVQPASISRANFMAGLGLASGAMFGIVVIGQTIPMFFLRLCD